MIEHPEIDSRTSTSVWGQYGFKMGYNGVSVVHAALTTQTADFEGLSEWPWVSQK